MSKQIEDYALISDLETDMLGRDGSIDWLCLPRFDSPACFASLVGSGDNGFWRVSPVGGGPCTHRAYREDTLVLDSVWETESGAVRVTDFMPLRGKLPCVARMVEGISGSVPMRSELRLRFHHGRIVPWVRVTDQCAVAVAGPDSVWVSTDGPLHRLGREATAVLDFTIEAGRRLTLMLVWAPSHLPALPAPLCLPSETALKETSDFSGSGPHSAATKGPGEKPWSVR